MNGIKQGGKKMRKKSIMIILCLSVLMVLGSLMAAASTKVEYWTTMVEEERQVIIRGLVSKFEAENPDIDIEIVALEENDIPTKLAAGMAAGMLPEVTDMGAEMVLRLGAEEMLNIEAANQVIDELGRDDFYKGALKMLTSPSGGNYAVPFHGWVQGIWYRKDLFEEKGLEAPTTWDSILKAAKEFYNPGEQKYGIVIGTNKDAFARQTFTQYALSNNARVFNEDGEIIFNSPAMIETLGFYKELAKYTPPGPEGWRESRDLYLSGRIPMMMYSTYIMDDIGIGNTGYEGSIVENLGEKTALANVMYNKAEATFGQINALSIVKGNDDAQVEGAKKFVKFMLSDDNYITYLHMAPGGSNPVRHSIASDPRYLDNTVLKVYGEEATNIASGLNSIGKFGYVGGKVFTDMGKISSQFIIGEALFRMTESDWSPEQTAEWAQKEMEKAVK